MAAAADSSGSPSRAATPAATTPPVPSEVSRPVSSRSNGSWAAAAAITRIGRRQVGALERRIGDEHAALGAHRERLAHRLGGVGGGHRQDRHLPAVRLDELQRGLERVLVVAVDDGRRGGTVEPEVGAGQAFGARGRVGNGLGQDEDLHGA